MPTIPPNNSTGLYGIDGSSVAISNDVTVDNLAATGNITAGANIAAGNNVTVGGNLTVSGTIFGNITGNLVVPGANTEVLFNSDGNAGASSDFTFNDNTNILDVNGNVQANYFIGDGSQLTGLPASYGNANVNDHLAAFGSNVIVTTGNITGGYFIGNGSQLTGLPATYDDANVNAHLAAFGSNTISTTGNITGGFFIGDGSQLSNINAGNIIGTYGNANVNAHLAAFGSNTISTTGNISGGNITGTGLLIAPTVGVQTSISGTGIMTYGDMNAYLGNVTGANLFGTIRTASQPNITTVGNLSSLTVTGDSLLQGNLQVNGNVTYIASNTVTINDKFINVANNAATASAANGGGIGVGPVGAEYATWSFSDANTAWQSNIKIEAPALTTTGNVTGSYIIGDGSLLTNINAGNIVGSYGNANVATFLGTGFGSNSITTTGNVTAGNLAGNGSLLSNITGANVTGTVANATFATTAASATTAGTANSVAGGNVSGQVANALVAGTVYTAAQPNITSVGTLTSLAVTGNISGGNVNSTFFGSGAGLSSLTGANVTGTVANATFATSATTAGTVTTNAQPNITSVGTLSSLSVTGNIGTGGILTDGYYYANGTPVSFGGGSTSVIATGNVFANTAVGNGKLWLNGGNSVGIYTSAGFADNILVLTNGVGSCALALASDGNINLAPAVGQQLNLSSVKINGGAIQSTSINNSGKITSSGGSAAPFNGAQKTQTGTSSGSTGDIAWDSNYIYVCTAANTWKRVALSSF